VKCAPPLVVPVLLTAFVALRLALATPAFGQSAPVRFDHPVALVGAQYGAPTRWFGSAGVLIAPPRPFQPGTAPDSSRAGLVVTGGAGAGGYRFASGVTGLALEGPYLTTGFDGLFTVTRTNHSPRGAAADSTYLGGEIGVVLMSVRLSAGAAHRTSGTNSGKATIFTWSVGVQIPLGW
jgi:hypothetical protein